MIRFRSRYRRYRRRSGKRWIRFHSKRQPRSVYYAGRDLRQDERKLLAPQFVNYTYDNTDVFDVAERRVVMLLQRRPGVTDLDRRIQPLMQRFESSRTVLDGIAALLVQVPRAVLAQIEMDGYPRGYRNKEKRLFELIDFNDTLEMLVLAADDTTRSQIPIRIKQAADRICQRVGAPAYSDEQWTAIVRGLTREVAVYYAAIESGLDALLTARESDALGIDVQVRDPSSNRYINVDVKTPSAFRHRMEQLVREGRLTERQLVEGDQNSYIIEHNGRGVNRAEIILLCILPDRFGDLDNWRFVDNTPMREMLVSLIQRHGLGDGRFASYISMRRRIVK